MSRAANLSQTDWCPRWCSFADASALATYRVCQLARENVTVALSGDGADEAFAAFIAAESARWGAVIRQGGIKLEGN